MCGERRNNVFISKNKKGNDTNDMIILINTSGNPENT